ncbi:FimD/PapC C-terminal domain-containing protein, partial [Rahnella contaminans]|uniref:FimD/PapC C-terminal domain-containing protein n=1 Tax=Rahnella contaminans TaxID=2703882 RepID=UPI003C30BDAD
AGDDGNAGIVSDGGQVYLSGVPASGTVLAKWGNGKDDQCLAGFKLPDTAENTPAAGGVINLEATCE